MQKKGCIDCSKFKYMWFPNGTKPKNPKRKKKWSEYVYRSVPLAPLATKRLCKL